MLIISMKNWIDPTELRKKHARLIIVLVVGHSVLRGQVESQAGLFQLAPGHLRDNKRIFGSPACLPGLLQAVEQTKAGASRQAARQQSSQLYIN